MYSHEIDRLLKIKQNIITYADYLDILTTSPQINHIKYNSYDDIMEIKTDDNYKFKIKIKRTNP